MFSSEKITIHSYLHPFSFSLGSYTRLKSVDLLVSAQLHNENKSISTFIIFLSWFASIIPILPQYLWTVLHTGFIPLKFSFFQNLTEN